MPPNRPPSPDRPRKFACARKKHGAIIPTWRTIRPSGHPKIQLSSSTPNASHSTPCAMPQAAVQPLPSSNPQCRTCSRSRPAQTSNARCGPAPAGTAAAGTPRHLVRVGWLVGSALRWQAWATAMSFLNNNTCPRHAPDLLRHGPWPHTLRRSLTVHPCEADALAVEVQLRVGGAQQQRLRRPQAC